MITQTELLDTFLNIIVFIFIGLLVKLYTTIPDKLDDDTTEHKDK